MRNENEQEHIDNLLALIKENPELEIVPMVDSDVVKGDDYGSWMGTWGSANIDHVCIPDYQKDKHLDTERIYFKSLDEDEIAEYIFSFLEKGNPIWSDSYIEERVEAALKEIEWEKVIAVNIN